MVRFGKYHVTVFEETDSDNGVLGTNVYFARMLDLLPLEVNSVFNDTTPSIIYTTNSTSDNCTRLQTCKCITVFCL